MPVCEGVVGTSLQALFDSLDSPELVNFAPQCGVEADLIEGMEKQVSKLLPVISDAEANQFKSDPVRKWLEELKDAAYDAEDVLDLFQTESLRCKLKQLDSPSPSHIDCASPLQVLLDPSTYFVTSLNDKIKHINKRLEAIVRRKKALGLKKGIPGTCARESPEPRLETSPLVNEPRIYGRDKDVDKLIKLLLSAEPCNANVGVIPIVGQGGIGKTTFAQRLYNHIAVESHFQLRAWVCVSDLHAFDVIRVTKGIIESATRKSSDLSHLPAIHEELKKMLEGKKFLLVLDDVWTEEYKDWIALSTPFEAGAKGSKVLITTRSEKVCSITGTISPYHLDLLSEDDSFSLFKRHAFQNQNTQAQPALERIGMGIVRKCNGLPLAIKALGGVLRSKHGEGDWKDILYSEIWDLLDQETELGPALWLSYYHLPAHLKTCFAYCGTFPKRYQFDKEKLIRLWMAEGFLQQKDNRKIKKRMEDVGEGYFCELVSRSFFQQSSEDNSSIFIMHHLINDLAGAASGETCFTFSDDDEEASAGKQISENTRHLSCEKFSIFKYGLLNISEALYGATKLRTLVYLLPVPCDLLRLVCLRVLDLGACSAKVELPESIGNLVHLRYLDLSFTSIETLPESINALCNLQTLLLRGCKQLTELPSNMGSLINLRYLDINECGIKKMSRQMGRLKELQMLPFFIVDENNGAGIEELADLEQLRGELRILGLENVRDPIQKKINLRNKPNLETLELIWNDHHLEINDSQAKSVAKLLLDRLQPCTDLKGLTIANYYGTSFPSWLVDPLCYSNLVKLTLQNCKSCKSLPPFDQLPSLEELSISGMSEWQEWIGAGQEGEQGFTRLRDLTLYSCPKLKIVPHSFPALVKLYVCDCEELTSFSRYQSLGCNEVVEEGLQHPKETKLPTMLERISIQRCNNLKLLPEEFFRHTSLKKLVIQGCSFLNSFSRRDSGCSSSTATINISQLKSIKIGDSDKLESLPESLLKLTSLKSLYITGCYRLRSLPDEILHLSCLEKLQIYNCPRLVSFPQGGLPSTKLKRLIIENCEDLRSLPTQMILLTSLEKLRIGDCPNLLSIPEGGLPSLNLRDLEIINCKGLKSLGDQLQSLTSLRLLYIYNCPGLMSFPKGNFPSNLETLIVSIDCNFFLPSSAWEFHFCRLTSLAKLVICGYEGIESIPEWLLPSTLTCLVISSFPDLKTLPGLQQHNSLRLLSIINCPKLASLMLNQGLNIIKLRIRDCPLLEQWYEKEKGEYPFIHVLID